MKERRREKGREEEEGEEQKGMDLWVFCMESCVFWMSRVFGMDFHGY